MAAPTPRIIELKCNITNCVEIEASQSLQQVILGLEDSKIDNYSIARLIDYLTSVNLFQSVFTIGFKLKNIERRLAALLYNSNVLADVIPNNNRPSLFNNTCCDKNFDGNVCGWIETIKMYKPKKHHNKMRRNMIFACVSCASLLLSGDNILFKYPCTSVCIHLAIS